MMSRYLQGALVLTLVIAGLVMALSVSEPADATITGDVPPAIGPWVINNPTVVTDEVLYIDGNMTVNSNLDLRNSVLVINVTTPGQYNIEVGSTGRMTATDTTFSSNHTVAGYGFIVLGRADLLRCTVTGTEDGLRILTRLTVTITSTIIDDFHTGGMYLEDADGTTLSDVTIQSSRYETSMDVSRRVDERIGTTPQINYNYMLDTAPLHIKGGRPSIEGLSISVFGTISVSGTIDFYSPEYIQCRSYFYAPLVLVESDGLQDLVDISVIDSALDFSMDYTIDIHTSVVGRHYLYDYFHMCPIIFRNADVLAFEDITIEDVRLGAITIRSRVFGGMTNFYQYTEGSLGILVYIDETYEDTEVHTLDIHLKDSYFLRSGALYIWLAADGKDENRTKFALDLVVDSITIEENPVRGLVINNAVSYKNKLDFWVEIEVTDSSFNRNGGNVISFNLGGSGGASRSNVKAAAPGPGGSAFAGFITIYDNITIENCQFDENWGRCIEIISGGGGGVGTSGDISVVEKEGGGAFNGNVYEWIYVRDNVFDEHKGTSGSIYIVGVTGAHNGTETLIIERNSFPSADPGTSKPSLLAINGKDVIEITNNTFTDNIGGYAMTITSNGGDDERAQPASILISNNDFLGNAFWHTTEVYGIISATWGGNLEITRNKVSDDSSRSFLNIRKVPQYAGFSNLHLHHNEFVDSPDMTGVIYLYNYDVHNNLLTAIVEENLVRDCGGASVIDFYDQPVLDLEDNDPTFVFRNNTVMNAMGEVINIYGNLRIEDNTFTNCHGYVLNLPYLGKYIPIIERNTFSNCHDLIYMGGKAKNLGGLPIVLEDLEVDCTGNAFRFNNMLATLYNFDISDHANPAVIAENSLVSVVGGKIKVGSSRIIGPGSIIRYHLFEAIATWADATGADTGIPASDVPVVLLDSEGRLSITRSTNEAGSLGPLWVPVWSMRSMFIKTLTPHQLLIGTPGIANSMIIKFDQDYVGDEALSILVVDDQLPVIRVTSPIKGQYIRTDQITVNGFVLELGSGIDELTLSIEGRDPDVVSLDISGRFAHVLEDLPEGQIQMTLIAKDRAGNSNNTVLSIIVDWTPPVINVIEPGSGLTTSSDSVPLVIALEPGAVVLVNGIVQDNNNGQMSIVWSLSEGENIILVESTDAAGNTATESITVTRDSIPPHLIVLTPRDGLLTSDQTTLVTGDTEPGVDAWLVVLYDGEEVQNLILEPDDEGVFSLSVLLNEGTSQIVLYARDAALNLVEVRSQVTVDITPPEVAITSPVDGWLSNSGTIHVLGTADDDCLLYLNGMPVENEGLIDRTLILDDGETIIELLAVDSAGNMGVSRITVIMDTLKPVIDLVKPIEDSVRTMDPVLEIAGRVQGEFETLTVMGEEVTVSDGAFSKTVTLTSEGLNEIMIRATDAAGNVDEVVVLVDVSWTGPQLTVEFMTDGDTAKSTNGTALITGTAIGDIDVVQVIHTSTSGDVVQTYLVDESGDFTIAFDLEKGQNTLVVEAIDTYGNIDEAAPYTVEYAPSTESADEEGKIDLLDVGVVILAFGLALLAMVLIAGWLRSRNQT